MTDRGMRFSALVVAISSSFITPFMASSVNIALPAIQKNFGTNAVLLSWVSTAYLLATAVSLVPFGRLADIHGRKKIFLYGMIIFTISSTLAALSVSTLMLIILRVFQGVGSSMIFATRMAILTSVFPLKERGKVIGINVAAVYIGLSCGPFFGGMMTQHLGWRSIFLLGIPLGSFVIYLIIKHLKGEWAEAEGEPFDMAGAVIYVFTLVFIMYGFSRLPSILSVGLLLFGIAGIAIFIMWESKIEYPVFEISLFRENRLFVFSCLAALINYSATFGVTFLLSLYLQYIKGLSPQQAGFILVSQPVIMATIASIAGRLSDKIEPRIISSTGMALTAFGLLLLTGIDSHTSLKYIILCLMLLGSGFGFFSSPNTNAIMSSVEKRFYGVASGSVGTMRLLGQMLSMGIATLTFALFIGRVQISPDNYPEFMKSVSTAFIIFSCLCTGGIFLSLSRGKVRNERKS
jgi:EmrB/QacA subfamily drug resistance transporter